MIENNEQMYFAAKDADKAAGILLQKASQWFDEINTNGYLDKLRDMWMAYHNAYYADFESGHTITFGGENGELVNMSVNHIRNFATIMLNMITATRPSLQARATNTDHKSLVQTKLANGLLDYYMREKRLEEYLVKAVEYAIVMGSGYVKLEWNSTTGETYDFNEETGVEIKEGDIEFKNLTPFDVVFDGSKEDTDHDWVICRSFKNRHDFIAKYPEFTDEIATLPTKSEIDHYGISSGLHSDTEEIPVYEFYHRRTESMPDGRYMLFLSDSVILLDTPLPYREIPVYRISAGNILGTPYSYTALFDVLPIQEVINSLYSTIATNQHAFGVQNILTKIGSDINISQVAGGLNIMEVQDLDSIRPLNLTQTPPEVFNFLKMLEQSAETISGVNSVSRGQPEPSLKSGTALALIQSMSIQFMSRLQNSYVRMVEDIGTGMINMLKDFASVPRVAMISGIQNRAYMKEFTGDDLSSVNRVIVDIANPLASTTAGRAEMASEMLQMGLITTPEQYYMVLNTGQLETMTENTTDELLTIRKENENLLAGKDVMAIATDQHAMHIREHKFVLSDPDLRFDPQLLQRTLDHIQEHINQLQQTDPNLLQIISEQPLGPPGGSPANQQQPNVPNQPPADMAAMMQNVTQNTAATGQPNMPNLPQPPAPFENNPVLAEQQIPRG